MWVIFIKLKHTQNERRTPMLQHLQPEELHDLLLDERLIGEGHGLQTLGIGGGDLSTSDTLCESSVLCFKKFYPGGTRLTCAGASR